VTHRTLVLGGARSGKSGYAEGLLPSTAPGPFLFRCASGNAALKPEMLQSGRASQSGSTADKVMESRTINQRPGYLAL